jgi:hypothetical protein
MGGAHDGRTRGLCTVTTDLAVTSTHPARIRSGWAWLSGGCLAVSALAAVAVALVAAIHIDDRYAVDHASGARIALARYADHGVLYPPLVGEDTFGGTRFMPLPVLLHAALSRLTGEYLVSGKVLAVMTMLGVGVVMFAVLRRSACPVPIAAGLVGVVLTTQTGLLAVTGLRGDSLPLLLQLLAIAVVANSGSRRATWVSAVLAALAVTAKLHALWAPAAILVWLWTSDRRRFRDFAVVFVASTALLLGGLAAVTRGRFLENVFGLSAAGVNGPAAVVTSPYRLLQLLISEAPGTWLLLPFALTLVGMALRRGSVDPWQLSLVAALLVLLVVLSDIGTGGNQLLDIVVLSAVVVGRAAGHAPPEIRSITRWRMALSAVIVWVLVSGMAVAVAPAVRDALGALRDPSRYDAEPLAGVADKTTDLLSEDPYVPVSLGQDPVVLDPFMLPRIGSDNPAAVRALVERIDDQDFELIALVEPLGDSDWWADYHFGTRVMAAVERSYTLSERIQGYDIYKPRPGD